jgi:two-component system sensor kinase FixL
VLLNLLSNAIQAIEQAEDDGPKWVEVIAGRCGGDNVQITVRDSGPGATDAQIAEMFNPFFTTKPTGTGMGLNICETIIHHHGGHLWAERNRHRGLSMHIRLPLDTDEQ